MGHSWRVAGSHTPLRTPAALRRHLLQLRGIEAEAEASFFSPLYERDIVDPLEFADAGKAVDRIFSALKKKERILVWGDYDADGISSTAILVSTLEALGGNVVPFLPHREEHGYGLHQGVLTRIVGDVDFVITCDCGVANAAEIAWLAQHGVDTVVLDHHTIPPELPAAVAVVHPEHPTHTYSGGLLCGAGVSWKIASALLRDKRSPFHKDPDREKWLLDLAVLGTVADMVPLRGENRAIVQFGLEVLRRTRRPGLEALLSTLQLSRATLSAEDIAFKLAPRLNAAGRMDHPQPALDLLLTQDPEHALELVARLETLNRQRQTVTAKMLKEAAIMVSDDPIIFAYSNTWRSGVVGLTAGKLADRYGRPAVVIGTNGRHAVGSARSSGGVNILEVLERGRSHLLALGGHPQAAGFSLAPEALAEFRAAIVQGGESTTTVPLPPMDIEAVVDPALIQIETLHLLDSFAPFGIGNPRPTVLIKNLLLREWRPVGKSGEHVKFIWDNDGEALGGIGFSLLQIVKDLPQNAAVDVVGKIEANEWRGQRSLQLSVEDIALAGTVSLT